MQLWHQLCDAEHASKHTMCHEHAAAGHCDPVLVYKLEQYQCLYLHFNKCALDTILSIQVERALVVVQASVNLTLNCHSGMLTDPPNQPLGQLETSNSR